MGSITQPIDDATSIALNNQIALGYSLPPIIPLKTIVTVQKGKYGEVTDPAIKEKINEGLKSLGSTYWQVPVTFEKTKDGESDFLFPLDPLISLSGKNIITRRYVSKSKNRGSIKERWSEDDYEITITGLLQTDDEHDINYYQQQIRKFKEATQSVGIVCDFLNSVFDIYKITIESVDFPFTKGVENQAFTIKGYSDDNYTLLVEKNVVK